MRKHYAAWMAVVLFCAALLAQAAAADTKPRPQLTRDEKQLEQELRRIDREAQQTQGEERVLAQLSADLGLSADTLRSQKQSSNLSYGNLFIANSLARATGNTFENIVSMHHNGKAWGQIAQEHNVKLGEVVSNARRSSKAIETQRHKKQSGVAGEAFDEHGHQSQGMRGQQSKTPAAARPARPPKPPGRPH